MTNPLRPHNRRIVFATFAAIGLVLLLGFPSAALAAIPQAETNDVFSTGATTATVDGLVNPQGESTTYNVQWDVNSSTWCQNFGTVGSPAHMTSPTPFPDTGTNFEDVQVDLTGLTGGTDYCAQLIANNGSGESDGGTFEWIQGLPEAVTTGQTPTGATTSTIQGQVNPIGQSTTYKVQWDVNSSTWCQSFATSGSPANTTPGTMLSFSDNTLHDVSVGITGLASGTDYCAQLVATNGSGEGDGGTVEWTQTTPQSTLTVTPGGTGSGTVTSSPAGINCGATCAAPFDQGTQVTLTAAAAAGSTFAGWSGGGCSGTSACKVTLSADTTVTATFDTAAPVNHTLTVTPAGSGTGSVTSSPAGIDCGATCSHAFAVGTQVTLTATADSGSTFTGWSGGGCSGTGNCVVTLNNDTTMTATFSANPPPPPPKPCIVPKLKGKRLAAAKSALKKAHCSVGRVTKVKSATRNKGRVVSQSPKPGKHLAHGAKVALKVGK